VKHALARAPSTHRSTYPQTFISKEHEKACIGDNTPGPVTAEPHSASGPQLLSTKASAPGWGFGTSKARAPPREGEGSRGACGGGEGGAGAGACHWHSWQATPSNKAPMLPRRCSSGAAGSPAFDLLPSTG
jgi:hypothetical protein